MSIQFDFSKIVRVKKMTQKQIKRAEHKAIMKEEIDKKIARITRALKGMDYRKDCLVINDLYRLLCK